MKTVHRPRWIALALLLIAVPGLLALVWLLRGSRPPAAHATLVIATNTEYLGACPVIASQRQGYFARYGLTVQVLPFTSGKQALNAVLMGKAQLATAADIAIMFAALERKPIQVLATIYRVESDHGVVAWRDSDIARPADLKGKRIGVTLQTSGHFTLDAYLNRQRLSARDVQLVNLPPQGLLAAMRNREVDAVAGWDPFLQDVTTQLGEQVQRFSGSEVYESIYNLVAMRQFVHDNGALVPDLLRALRDGEQFCRAYPLQASSFLTNLPAARRDALLESWSRHRFHLDLDQDLLLALEDQGRWALKDQPAGRREAPNFFDYIYLDGLQAVSPTDVTIIH